MRRELALSWSDPRRGFTRCWSSVRGCPACPFAGLGGTAKPAEPLLQQVRPEAHEPEASLGQLAWWRRVLPSIASRTCKHQASRASAKTEGHGTFLTQPTCSMRLSDSLGTAH